MEQLNMVDEGELFEAGKERKTVKKKPPKNRLN
jgi:hypothetical protein